MPALLVQSLFSDLRTQLTSVQLLCTLHVESTVFLVWELLIRTNKFVASKIILGTQKKSNLERAEIGSLPFEMENSHRMTIERKKDKKELSFTHLALCQKAYMMSKIHSPSAGNLDVWLSLPL